MDEHEQAIELIRAEVATEARLAAIEEVRADPGAFDLFATAVSGTPYTHGWYFQPEWGWLWTRTDAFPYVYRSATGGQTPGWLYFKEGSADPIRFYSYTEEKWITLGG